MKDQTTQSVTMYCIVFCLLQTLQFFGSQFFSPPFLQQVFPVLFVFTVHSVCPSKPATGCHYSDKMKNYFNSAAWFLGLNPLVPVDNYNCPHCSAEKVKQPLQSLASNMQNKRWAIYILIFCRVNED